MRVVLPLLFIIMAVLTLIFIMNVQQYIKRNDDKPKDVIIQNSRGIQVTTSTIHRDEKDILGLGDAIIIAGGDDDKNVNLSSSQDCSVWTAAISWMGDNSSVDSTTSKLYSDETCTTFQEFNNLDEQKNIIKSKLHPVVPQEIIQSISSMLSKDTTLSSYLHNNDRHQLSTNSSSIVFLHMTHTGGSSIRTLMTYLCETRKLNCILTGSAKKLPDPQTIPKHSIDILYGHFEFNPQIIDQIMKPTPIIFTILRDPWEVARSSFFYTKINDSPSTYLHSSKDMIHPRLIGIPKRDYGKYDNFFGLDEHCSLLAEKLQHLSLIGFHPYLNDVLMELQRRMPQWWNVTEDEIVIPKINVITSAGKDGVDNKTLKYAKSVSYTDRWIFAKNWKCSVSTYLILKYASSLKGLTYLSI